MKFKEMVEGKEYMSQDKFIYSLKEKALFCVSIKDYSELSMSIIIKMNFTELPWKPELNERYYFVSADSTWGYDQYVYNGGTDEMILKRIKVYKTREEVIQAVKDLGWEV